MYYTPLWFCIGAQLLFIVELIASHGPFYTVYMCIIMRKLENIYFIKLCTYSFFVVPKYSLAKTDSWSNQGFVCMLYRQIFWLLNVVGASNDVLVQLMLAINQMIWSKDHAYRHNQDGAFITWCQLHENSNLIYSILVWPYMSSQSITSMTNNNYVDIYLCSEEFH